MATLLQNFWAWLLASGAIWYVAAGVISLLFSKKSQLDHWVEESPRRAALHKILRSVGFDPWMFLQGFWLLVRGKLPPSARNLLPADPLKDEEAPPTPKN